MYAQLLGAMHASYLSRPIGPAGRVWETWWFGDVRMFIREVEKTSRARKWDYVSEDVGPAIYYELEGGIKISVEVSDPNF